MKPGPCPLNMEVWLGRSFVAAGETARRRALREGAGHRASHRTRAVALAQALRQEGQAAQAVALQREVMPLGATLYGSAHHPELDSSRLEMAPSLAATGTPDAVAEARVLVSELLPRLEAARGPGHPLAVLARRVLEDSRIAR